MPERTNDAVVVGSGPNGLAAAIVLAQAGRRVTLIEGAETVGGGCRSEELTLPGYVHDPCSTVHSLALSSPFLSGLPLANGDAKLRHFRIDEDHSNAFAVWKRMGSPQQPTPEQYAQLEKAGQLAALGASEGVRIESGKARVRLKLPRQAVSMLQLGW